MIWQARDFDRNSIYGFRYFPFGDGNGRRP